jgi:RNA polymerase sigma-70 factor (ECF subfamily)
VDIGLALTKRMRLFRLSIWTPFIPHVSDGQFPSHPRELLGVGGSAGWELGVGFHPTVLPAPESIGRVTDEELVLLARQGDPDAFDQLVVRHQSAVYRAALAALRVPQDAEEVAQDAFVRAWTHLGKFRGDSAFKTWLLTITWNRAMSRRRSVAGWFHRSVAIGDVVEPVESGRPQDAAVHDTELHAHARRAIQGLTPKLRDALLLAQSGDYGYDEIGTMLKIPVGTVKWRVSEARRKVREQLAKLGYVDAR